MKPRRCSEEADGDVSPLPGPHLTPPPPPNRLKVRGGAREEPTRGDASAPLQRGRVMFVLQPQLNVTPIHISHRD